MNDEEKDFDEADKEEDGEIVDAVMHELMEDYGLDKTEAKRIKKIMEEKGIDAHEAIELEEDD